MAKIGVDVTKAQLEKACQLSELVTDVSSGNYLLNSFSTGKYRIKGTVRITFSLVDVSTLPPYGTQPQAIQMTSGTFEVLNNGFVLIGQYLLAKESGNSYFAVNGSYENLLDKPIVNGVLLTGEKSLDDFGIQEVLTAGDNITIEDGVISATGGSGKDIVSVTASTDGQTRNKMRIYFDDGTSVYSDFPVIATLPTGQGGTYDNYNINALATYLYNKVVDLESKVSELEALTRVTLSDTTYTYKLDAQNGKPVLILTEVQ